MTEIEYLGGVPGHERAAGVGATVQGDTLRLKHGHLFGGWTYQVPLAAIVSAESATAREVIDAKLLAAGDAARLEPHERFLIIAVSPGDHTATIVLRGPWSALSDLRQAILQGRMRAAKQWHS